MLGNLPERGKTIEECSTHTLAHPAQDVPSDEGSRAAVNSQLIDNPNASIHPRALLRDRFLVGEITRKLQP